MIITLKEQPSLEQLTFSTCARNIDEQHINPFIKELSHSSSPRMIIASYEQHLEEIRQQSTKEDYIRYAVLLGREERVLVEAVNDSQQQDAMYELEQEYHVLSQQIAKSITPHQFLFYVSIRE